MVFAITLINRPVFYTEVKGFAQICTFNKQHDSESSLCWSRNSAPNGMHEAKPRHPCGLKSEAIIEGMNSFGLFVRRFFKWQYNYRLGLGSYMRRALWGRFHGREALYQPGLQQLDLYVRKKKKNLSGFSCCYFGFMLLTVESNLNWYNHYPTRTVAEKYMLRIHHINPLL